MIFVIGWIQRHHVVLGLLHALILLTTIILDYSLTFHSCDLFYWCAMARTLLNEHLFLPKIVAKFALMFCIAFECFSPHQWVIRLFKRRARRRFANFIVRRLVMQLDQASESLPKSGDGLDLSDPLTQQNYVQARMAQYRAMDLFRRDANALLVQRLPLIGNPHLFVLEEEEDLLARAGYSSIGLQVTEQVIQDLIRPYHQATKDKRPRQHC
ncbi:GL15480 [Drosophila persimilis]|uniref:GL15480 n=1 Tax=Drosophila persimilis TaxID=7234 RepID=B4H6M7_DROPE|nr:GL15480 [Drosophila persimilis]